MAGLEELEVHSKSYLVRWIHVKSNHTISWSLQPHKKSLNFGVFKHPGHSAGGSSSTNLPVSEFHNTTDSSENLPSTATTASRHTGNISVTEKLTGIGLKQIKWVGKCEADKIAQGTYDVPPNEGGNYALVFDNTFSKQTSKNVTFVLLTYPSAIPPQSGLVPPTSHAITAPARDGESTESLRPTSRRRGNSLLAKAPPQFVDTPSATVHMGLLHKRRRKRHQGWARRFFSLDYTSSTLSYYHDRNSSALRGSIPLSLAAVACNEKTREISVDSGAEIWHLRANNDQEFVAWKRALEKASSKSKSSPEDNHPPELLLSVPSQRAEPNPAEEREWEQVESLVSQVSGSRDAVRRLARDTDPKYLSPPIPSPADRPRGRSKSPNRTRTPSDANGEEYFAKRPFWKRKTSGGTGPPPGPTRTNTDSSGGQLAVPKGADIASLAGDRKPSSITSHPDQGEEIHDHLMALLRDLDQVVSNFSSLISQSKERRNPPGVLQPRRSMESDVSQEFFDANDGGDDSPLLTIHDSDDEGADNAADAAARQAEEEVVGDDVPSDSDDEAHETSHDQSLPLFPSKPKSLLPLPLDGVKRRNNILAPTVLPPSLIGFLRKNVGKDLSQISTPVSANEPFSLLQRASEIFEYSTLLDQATNCKDSSERLMYVTAFAIASLSSNRIRERVIRKPFNPMLGETYELVREDLGFRFIAEKVSHRPVQLAYQADAKDWSLAQSPMPTQKFWGKSAEIVTEGKLRLTLHATGEHFSWSAATSFLRNIIAGEKYVEPVGEFAVLNETNGQKATTTFKAGGMFSGRSEEISTKAVDSYGNELPLGLTGTWTSSLQLTKNGSASGTIWTAGSLVPNAQKHYGLTTFAATLNEITPIEDSKLPPTDSRLRPDQRALEDGDLDKAEEVKVQLEEGQRARRREYESAGKNWEPRWFSRVDENELGGSEGEVAWRLKGGKDGYWEERSRGNWAGVVPVFEV